MRFSRPLRERTSIIATCLAPIAALLAPSASWTADLVVETAVLTVNYRLGAADGNMIASPYIAEMPTGESYKVDSLLHRGVCPRGQGAGHGLRQ